MGSRTYSSDERHLDPHEVRSPLGGSLTYSGRDKFVDTDMEHILHKFSTSMTGDILTGRIVYPRSKAKRRDKKAMDRDPLKTKEEASVATQKAQHKFQSRPSSRRITIGTSPLPGMDHSDDDDSGLFKTPGQPRMVDTPSSDSDTTTTDGASDDTDGEEKDPFEPSNDLLDLGRDAERTHIELQKAAALVKRARKDLEETEAQVPRRPEGSPPDQDPEQDSEFRQQTARHRRTVEALNASALP